MSVCFCLPASTTCCSPPCCVSLSVFFLSEGSLCIQLMFRRLRHRTCTHAAAYDNSGDCAAAKATIRWLRSPFQSEPVRQPAKDKTVCCHSRLRGAVSAPALTLNRLHNQQVRAIKLSTQVNASQEGQCHRWSIGSTFEAFNSAI